MLKFDIMVFFIFIFPEYERCACAYDIHFLCVKKFILISF